MPDETIRAWIAALAACAGVLSLSGCATLQPDRPPLEATLADERALAALEIAFQAAATSAIGAVDAGLVEPGSPEAVALADKVERAHAVLRRARAAQAAGQTQALAALVAEALALIGEIGR
jgi:hypothetical protein